MNNVFEAFCIILLYIYYADLCRIKLKNLFKFNKYSKEKKFKART